MDKPLRLALPGLLIVAVTACTGAHADAAESDPEGDQASEGSEALSTEALSTCAGIIRTLRSESERLNEQAAQFNARREALAEEYGEMEETRADEGGDGSGDRWARYNAQATAFNEDIKSFRQDVADISEVKQRYDAECADRPYRQSDLEQLPEADRKAMRRGTGDIRVPHSSGDSSTAAP